MEAGKMINRISNRLRRRSGKAQETIGITGAKGNILNYILLESEKHNVYQKDIEKGVRPAPLHSYRGAEESGGGRTDRKDSGTKRTDGIKRLSLQTRRR